MSNDFEELETLWKSGSRSEVEPSLQQTVIKQTRMWYLLLVAEVIALLIGLFFPFVIVIQNPEPFWIFWAVDLWGVVAISGWFTLTRARSLLYDLDQTTEAYERLLRKRYSHQIIVSQLGILLASIQFVVLPLLYWYKITAKSINESASPIAFVIVLLVMVGYILTMLRVAKSTRRKLNHLTSN